MIDQDIIKQDTQILKANIDKKRIESDQYYHTLDLEIDDFETDKEQHKFIRKCERIIRISPEYSIWTEYLREVLGYITCELTGEIHEQTCVDIHHHPVSLYTIVQAVIKQKILGHKKFTSLGICNEVLQLHYELRAPFCLLVRSLHEKFHNGCLDIPMNIVHGDYKHFLNTYSHVLDPDVLETINNRLSINFDNCVWGKEYSWKANSYQQETR